MVIFPALRDALEVGLPRFTTTRGFAARGPARVEVEVDEGAFRTGAFPRPLFFGAAVRGGLGLTRTSRCRNKVGLHLSPVL